MFSDFKYIDVNLNTDPVDTTKYCIWFTVPVAVHEEVDKKTGDTVKKYEYLFFPSTAVDEEQFIFRTLDAPYYSNLFYGLVI